MLKTVFKLLGPKRCRKLPLIIFMMFLASLLEMVSIVAVLEICRQIIEPASTAVPVSLPKWLLLFIALYVQKITYLLVENHVLARYVCRAQHEISTRLYSGLLRKPYLWFTETSSATVINLLDTDTSRAGGYLDAFLDLASELLVLIVLGTVLAFISPVLTLFAFLGAVLSFWIAKVALRPAAVRTGKARQSANQRRLQWLKQSFLGIKEMKIWQTEAYFTGRYTQEDRVVADCDASQRAFTRIPGLCIEGIMAVTLLVCVLCLTFRGNNLRGTMPVLAAFAAGAVRLLPAVRRISNNLTRMSNMKVSVNSVLAALAQLPESDNQQQEKEIPLRRDLTFSHVTFSYEGRQEPVLRDLSLTIPAGASIGLVGPSGAGKSTWAGVLLGLLDPQSGCVMADGTDIREGRSSFLRQTAYTPQDVFLLDDSVRNNVLFGSDAGAAEDSAVSAALEKASLGAFVKKLPNGMDTQIGENGIRLSGGERLRLGIARALYRGANLLVFDEATSALDPETEQSVMEAIQNLKGSRTLVIISHRLSTVSQCDRIYNLEKGKVTELGK